MSQTQTNDAAPSISRRAFLARTGVVLGTAVAATAIVGEAYKSQPPGPRSTVLGTTIVNVKAYGAIGDGVTDDTVAIRRAAAVACARPGTTLYLPKGRYRMDQWQHPSIMWTLLGVAADGLTIQGDGPDQTVLVTRQAPAGGLAMVVCVHGGEIGWQNRGFFDGGLPTWLPSLPVVPFASSSLPAGAMQVPLKSTTGFKVGDWVYIRSGQMTPSGNLYQPDSEINQVVAVGPTSLSLRWPTAKAYRPERFTAAGATTGITAVDGLGAAAPIGISRATGRICQDVAIRDLSIDAPVGVYLAMAVQAVGATVQNVTGTTGLGGVGGQYVRTMSQKSLNIRRTVDNATYPGNLCGYATGSVDVVCDTITGTGDFPMNVHVHEGVAQARLSNLNLNYPASARTFQPGISVTGRNYTSSFSSSTISAGSTAPPLVIDDSCTAGGSLTDIALTTQGGSPLSGSVKGTGWVLQRVTGNKPIFVGPGNTRS